MHYIIYYRFCHNCIQHIGKLTHKCFACPNKYIFKGFHIISPEKTLNEIIYHNKSIARFGDGEFKIIFGKNIGFQKFNKRLSKKLKKVLNSKEKKLLFIYFLINRDKSPLSNKYIKKFHRKKLELF